MSDWDRSKAEKMWLAGESANVIAERVGAPSRSAVLGWIKRQDMQRGDAAPRVTWTEEMVGKASALWTQGVGQAEIVETIGRGLTVRALQRKMASLGVQRPARRRREPKPTKASQAAFSWGTGFVAPPRPPSLSLVAQVDAAPAATDGLKTLLERGPRECCWPVGRPDPQRGQLFCAAPTGFRQSYCADHGGRTGAPLKAVKLRPDARIRSAGRPERPDCDADLADLLGLSA